MDFGRVKLRGAVNQMYPPNFTILVNGKKAVQDSLVVFELEGTLPSGLIYEEPLCLCTIHRSGAYRCMWILHDVYNYHDVLNCG